MSGPMKFAYADPPYLGCGVKHYGHQHEAAADYDRIETHAALIERLMREYHAWALSLHSPSLRAILPLCPADVRVGGWFKPFASFKPNVNPGYCWEPVIFYGGRSAAARGGRTSATVRDYVEANITMQKGTSGAKPDRFCYWLFEFLGAQATDEFHDLFPGSGAVTRAWETWRWHNGAEASA
jgi:hypothetical protein